MVPTPAPAERLHQHHDEIHIWFLLPSEVDGEEYFPIYQQWINAKEETRFHRYKFDRHRNIFLLTRALVRWTLSQYIPIPPHEWRFELNQWGRPEIVPELNPQNLRFNLTNTEGLIACAVGYYNALGVDAENHVSGNVDLKIARRFFSDQETEALENTASHHQRDRFFDFWTLKESYIKARGMGLSIPLNKFAFHLEREQAIGISFADDFDDFPDPWRFYQFRPTAEHTVSLAVRHPDVNEDSIRYYKTIPNSKIELFDQAKGPQ